FTRSRVENASVEFDVETLRPTCRLLIGVPGSSNAFEISKRLGLSPLIVDRARQYLNRDQERVEDLIAGINATRIDLEKERTEAAKARLEAQRIKAEYEQRYSGAQQKAHDVLEKSRAQAAATLAQARREAEAIIDELKTALKQQRESERTQAIQSARKRLTEARSAVEGAGPARRTRTQEPPKGLKPGDAVLILSLDQAGYVLTPPDASGNVQVQAGIMKVNVSLMDLERADQPDKEKPKATTAGRTARSAAMTKAREITTELDLRGLTVEEALDKIDKYLDDAVLASTPMVRIIHGKGTGALRKAVTDFLRGHRHVSSFRLGGMGEGGDGVTVARLAE
ncbi:MAG TPA: Smr/MutS family protein, partial [Symbiobacteriaceae bacterium]|nr:Smr/MutS family protein [Symbiobacteriaceae bacterium]